MPRLRQLKCYNGLHNRIAYDSSKCYCGYFTGLEAPDAEDAIEKVSEVDLIGNPNHYVQGIECWDYIVSQGLGYLEGNVVKYITRYKRKNGLEDLRKAQAYLEKLIKGYEENSRAGGEDVQADKES